MTPVGGKPPRVWSERQGRWLLNLYPPLLFQRIRVVRFGPGFRTCEVRVARSLLTKNLNGSTFGGTIFSAADPIYAVMYWQIFARDGFRVQVWLKRAQIDYLKPAATPLTLEFALSDADVQHAERALTGEGRFECSHETEALDANGRACAVIRTDVYLRSPRAREREGSAF